MQSKSLKIGAVHARINLFTGIPSTVEEVRLNANLIYHGGLHLFGTTGSSNSDYHNALSLVSSEQIDPTQLVSVFFSLSDISKTIEYATSGSVLKTMVVCR
jgi:threonine dehydrogenase-like Zn-dependent dehydrogenase